MQEFRVTATIDTRRATGDRTTQILGVVVTLDYPQSGHHLTVHLSGVRLENFHACNPSVKLPPDIIFEGEGIHEAICTAILEEVVKAANWSIPEVDVVNEARARMKGLIDFLAANGQSLGFDDDSDTLFIAPKGLQWDNQGKGGNDLIPVTAEELEYRSEHCDICSEKICFCRPNDGSEFLEKNGLRKAR